MIGNVASAAYSDDLNTWTGATTAPATRRSVIFQDVSTAARRFVAVGGDADIYGSSDGVNWAVFGTAANAFLKMDLSRSTETGTLISVAGNAGSGYVERSADEGVTWATTFTGANEINGAAFAVIDSP